MERFNSSSAPPNIRLVGTLLCVSSPGGQSYRPALVLPNLAETIFRLCVSPRHNIGVITSTPGAAGTHAAAGCIAAESAVAASVIATRDRS
jgi:hypothetical protein